MTNHLFPTDDSQGHHELNAQEARELTDKIRAGLEGIFELIKAAYSGFAWAALGYSSWDAYVQREFGNLHIQPPREERSQVVDSMRAAGLSTRAIATAIGSSQTTVRRDLAQLGEPNGSPNHADAAGGKQSQCLDSTRILGRDGRQYPASRADTSSGLVASQGEHAGAPEQRPGHVSGADVDVDAVLDTPAEDVGVTPLDFSEIQSERDSRISKLLEAFHGNDLGSLPRTMKLAEQISGLVSPLSGDISVNSDEYGSLATKFSSAVRQFSFVVKRLSQAKADYVGDDVIGLVVEDLRAALNFLRDSVQEMERK